MKKEIKKLRILSFALSYILMRNVLTINPINIRLIYLTSVLKIFWFYLKEKKRNEISYILSNIEK